jgi:hypothetical protein
MVLERDRMRDIGRDRERERDRMRDIGRDRERLRRSRQNERQRETRFYSALRGGLNRRERTSLGLLSNFPSFLGHK